MTGTLISLISILFGIIGANFTGLICKKYSFGFLGNTIVGVFGSILVIKLFGRLGFNPWLIMNNGDFDALRLAINLFVSFLGGCLGLIAIKLIKDKLNEKKYIK